MNRVDQKMPTQQWPAAWLMRALTTVTLAAAMGGCGGGAGGTSTQRKTTTAAEEVPRSESASEAASTDEYTRVDRDHDNDVGAAYDDTRHQSVVDFGKPASPAEERAIVALIKRYYAIALAENGTKACSLIYSPLAESVPEDYGSTGSGPAKVIVTGPAYMRGTTCPVVLDGLFKHFHKALAVEAPKLHVSLVRLREHHGLAVLSFGRLPERQVTIRRERHVWRMSTLLDSELP